MSATPIPAKEAQPFIAAGKAKAGMRVIGELKFQTKAKINLPEGLDCDLLDLRDCEISYLPKGLRCYELNLSNTNLAELPKDLKVEAILNCSNCQELQKLPSGLTVYSLNLQGCQSITHLPEDLEVWSLDMTSCWAFRYWPKRARVRSGRLNLRGCTALTHLPDYLGQLATVNIRDCPGLTTLPEGLQISGWIDVAQSGVADAKVLPQSLKGVDIRWQGVRIDERIICRPETIQIDEILTEENAELRRVLVDRFGVARFMVEAKAKVLDRDSDPGGPRELLLVEMKEDEPIVTLSCFCPSTKRQYFLRVPPDTRKCHDAAAWIAGFDNPDDYRPFIET